MKVLFFFPLGHRSGSEVALFELICHADRRRLEMAATCGHGAELLSLLPADVPAFVYREPGGAARDEELIERLHRRLQPDAWYVNTIVQPRVVALARALGVPCVLHTHELEEPLGGLAASDADLLVRYPGLVFAGSEAAADVLRTLGREDGLEVCSGPIDTRRMVTDPRRLAEVRARAGADAGVFLWVMSGSHNDIKDPSLFVDVAARLLDVTERVRFLWVGGSDNAYSVFVKAKARRRGLAGKLTWVPTQAAEYYSYLDAADGFVLTSKRESLGLVVLEAAALGKPIVAFDSAGPREIWRPGMGVLVEGDRSAAALAAAMLKVMQGEVVVDAAVSRRRAAEFDVAVQGPRWQGRLERYLDTLADRTDSGG